MTVSSKLYAELVARAKREGTPSRELAKKILADALLQMPLPFAQ